MCIIKLNQVVLLSIVFALTGCTFAPYHTKVQGPTATLSAQLDFKVPKFSLGPPIKGSVLISEQNCFDGGGSFSNIVPNPQGMVIPANQPIYLSQGYSDSRLRCSVQASFIPKAGTEYVSTLRRKYQGLNNLTCSLELMIKLANGELQPEPTVKRCTPLPPAPVIRKDQY